MTTSAKETGKAVPGVVTVGTVAFDTIHTPVASAERVLGGSATYFALGARFFTRPGIVGAIGNDFPESELAALQGRGIDTAGLQKLPGHRTFSWEGRYFEGFARRETLKVDVAIFEKYEPRLPEAWRQTPFVFLANGSPAHQLSLLEQARNARCVVSDSMNLWIETDRKGTETVFARSHGVILNDEEAQQFTGESSLLRAARKIKDLGPRFVIVKKGENGCLCLAGGRCFVVPGYPLEGVFDPTGAGDSFAGGVMGSLARNGDERAEGLREAVLWGSVLGSFCVETLGPDRLVGATSEDVEKRCAALRSMIEGNG